MRKLYVDIDGVILDLVGAFLLHLTLKGVTRGQVLRHQDVTDYNLLAPLATKLEMSEEDLEGHFKDFLHGNDLWKVDPIPPVVNALLWVELMRPGTLEVRTARTGGALDIARAQIRQILGPRVPVEQEPAKQRLILGEDCVVVDDSPPCQEVLWLKSPPPGDLVIIKQPWNVPEPQGLPFWVQYRRSDEVEDLGGFLLELVKGDSCT